MSTSKKNKIIPANTELTNKIGKGAISSLAIQRAEEEIKENTVDFAPIGLDFLKKLEVALDRVELEKDIEKQKANIIKPVMELKANAEMFHYQLVGDLANIMLNFVESIERLDKDATAITRSSHDSLKAILTSKMKGDGGKDGKTMVSELKDACARYYKKRK